MAMFDDETPPPGYRWEYSGSGNTAVRYPVPNAPTGEGSDWPIAPHREVPGEVPDAVPTLDQMRFELSQQPQSSLPSLPEYLANMPREIRDQAMALGEVGTSVLGSMISPVAAAATGVGKNIYDYFTQGRVDPKATNEAANRAAQLFSYQPIMPSAQSILQTVGEAPAAIMGTGQGLPPMVSGINPRALQVPRGTTGALGAGVKRDINQFDNDVFNAQRGITPGYPTLGSEFSDAFVTPRPTVYDMLAGLEPSRIPSTASPAVKTKGGNFPTSFDNDLEVSGQIGRHLNRLLDQVEPAKVGIYDQFDNLATIQYTTFLKNKGINLNKPLTKSESIPLINEFISTHKEQFPQLKTLDELEVLEQAKKAFITNQYARYLTNEMGTGAKTDTLVRLAEQGIAVPEIAQVFEANYPGRAADLEGPWVLPAVKNLLEANKLKGIEAVQQTATTPFGKYIESLTDEGVTPTSKKLYEDFLTLQKKLGLPTKYADQPTPFERIPEDMPIWDLPELWSNTELGLDRILQKAIGDLRSGAIKPENIKNVSIESLVRGLMNEYQQKLAAEAKELSTFPTVFQRPGSKNVWKNIVDEASDKKTVAMHKRVGDKMGICIGNADYCDRAISKKGFHDVLFGPNGEPHVAIESRPPSFQTAYYVLPEPVKTALDAEIASTLGYTRDEASSDKSATRENAFNKARANLYLERFGMPLPQIQQVKGKGNARNIDPKYIEDTRDFLNSKEWLPSAFASPDFTSELTLGGLVDTQYSKSLDAYAKRAKLSGDKAVLNKFEAAELLGRTRPGRFATDKEITEFINGPETLLYNHGSPTGGMTKLRTDIDRTRAAGTGLWLAQPYETAGTYAGMKGSIYGVEVKNEGLNVLDARNSEGGNIPLDAVIYHADGNKTTLKELADYLGVSTLSTDDVAKYSKSEGAKGLHILNVADISGRANPFVNTAPDYANNLVIFDPSIVKVIKEDKAPPFVPAAKQVPDAAFIGYLSPNKKFESYPESAASEVDYHHSYLMNDLDAYSMEGGLTFVRMNGEPIISIKGTPAMDPYQPKNSEFISDLARRIIESGANPDMPFKVEDMGFSRVEAPYQNKEIGTLREWSLRNTPKAKAEGGAVRMADGGAVTDTLDKMVKSPQASNLLNLDLPNLIAAKQQVRPLKRGGKVEFSNNIDAMRYALTRHQG